MDTDLLKSIHDDLQQIIQLLGNRQAGSAKTNSYKSGTGPSTRVFNPKERDALLKIIASLERDEDNVQKMLSPLLAKIIEEDIRAGNFKKVELGYIDSVKKAITYLSPTPYTAEDIKAVIKKCPDMKFKSDENGKWYLYISSSFPIEYDPDY